MLLRTALSILPLIGSGMFLFLETKPSSIPDNAILALAQAGGQYVDPDNGITFWGYTEPAHGVTYGYIFPPLSANSNEFIGEIVAPIATKWAGVSPGGAMVNNLLLVAWPNGNSIVRSARYATLVQSFVTRNTWVTDNISIVTMCNLRQSPQILELYVRN